jgi:type II secretory pathway pseudopilin PulG
MDLGEVKSKLIENKGLVLIVAVVLVVFIAFSVSRCTAVQNERSQTQQQEQQASGASDDVQNAESQLTDEQKQKQQNYSQDILQFISVLKANLWSTEDTAHFVAFTDKTFTERTDQGKSTTSAYVIDAVKTDKTKTDDATVEVSTAAIEVNDGTYFLTVTKETYTDNNVQYFLTSDVLAQPKSSYGPISASDQITVSGLNQDVLQLFGDDKENIESTVKDYSAKYLPTYTNFVWAKYATVNWDNNTVTITFTDGDNPKEILAVVYDRSNRTFKCNSI